MRFSQTRRNKSRVKWLAAAALFIVLCLAVWMKRDFIRGEIEFYQARQSREASIRSANTEELKNFLEQGDAEARRMAAVKLAQSGDAAGRGILIASIYSQTIFATSSGKLEALVQPGANVRIGQVIAVIAGESILSPINGRLRRYYQSEAGTFQPGQRVAEVVPNETSVKDGIESLAIIGKVADAEELESFAKAYPQFATIAVSASQTIRSRRK